MHEHTIHTCTVYLLLFTSISPVTEKISPSFNNLMSCPDFTGTRPFHSWPNTSGGFLSCPSPPHLKPGLTALNPSLKSVHTLEPILTLSPLLRKHLLPFLYDPDIGKDRGQEEKRLTEAEMIGRHYGFNGGSERQGSLACCSPWGRRVGQDLETEQLSKVQCYR